MLRDALRILFGPTLKSALNVVLFGILKLSHLRKLKPESLAGLLRSLLHRFPWWSRGHLELGLAELGIAASASERGSELRSFTAARISADAALELEGLAKELGGGGDGRLIARAKALKGLSLIGSGEKLLGLEVLKGALALNNLARLGPRLRIMALEGGAIAALECSQHELAKQLFRFVPEDQLSSSGKAAVANLH